LSLVKRILKSYHVRKSILILTSRDLDISSGAAYRTIYIAKYLSKFFKIFIIDARRNTYIISKNGFIARINIRKSFISILLSLIPSLLNNILMILFRFPKEEAGRIANIFNFGIFYDALRISSKIKPFIIIIEEYYSLYMIASLLRNIFNIKHLVLDLHNIDTLRLSRYPHINKLFIKLIYLLEKRAVNNVDLSVVVSHKDLYFSKKLFNVENVIVIPNFVSYEEIVSLARSVSEKSIGDGYIIYHGDFRYYPNREALYLLMRYIMPKIWKDHPNIKLIVAGPGLPQIIKEKVRFLGYVSRETLYKLICNACCAIVPLLRGGGTRIKILEYLACGIPVISTKIGAEGLEVENFKHLITVDQIEDIPQVFELIVRDDSLREKIKSNAIILIKEKYDINIVMEKFLNKIEEWIKINQIAG